MKVYLISGGIDTDVYKIGFTKREIEARMKEFKTGNSSEIFLVDYFESKWATKIEAALHRRYKSKLVDGEWYNLEASEVLSFRKECMKIEEAFNFISEENSWISERGFY